MSNKYDELYTVFSALAPGCLGTDFKHFKAAYADPIKRGGSTNAKPEAVVLAGKCQKKLNQLLAQRCCAVRRRRC